MSTNAMDVSYVAKLARLHLSEEEAATYQSQLAQVLKFVEQLGTLDLEGIEPTAHAFPVYNVTRRDEVIPSLTVEEALQNAPQKMNDLFRVPKVVE